MNVLTGICPECPAQKPAEVAALEFPGWAPFFSGAVFDDPARDESLSVFLLIDKQEIELAFDMSGNCPPALLITVNSFQRNAEQDCKLFLSLSQLFSYRPEFLSFHVLFPVCSDW